MRSAQRAVALSCVLVLGSWVDAAACSCTVVGPPCQATWTADAVFAGTVRAIEPFYDDPAAAEGDRLVRIRFDADQPFVNTAGGAVELLSANSTCMYHFVVGRRYLVYAFKDGRGRLSTSVCSRTRPLEEADEDLRYLKSIPPVGAGARVYGRVNEWVHDPAEERGIDHGPIENIVVNVRGATFSTDVQTDPNGRYELTGVPLGKVSIVVVTPFGFQPQGVEGLEIKDLRACVEANFTIAAVAGVSGSVHDASGQPADVMIEAVAAELAGLQPPSFHSPAKTDARGVFTFESLPPGKYVFGINLTKGQWKPPVGRPMFYPGVSSADLATVVELKPGDQKELGVLKLSTQ